MHTFKFIILSSFLMIFASCANMGHKHEKDCCSKKAEHSCCKNNKDCKDGQCKADKTCCDDKCGNCDGQKGDCGESCTKDKQKSA